jgi:hypothetical protein
MEQFNTLIIALLFVLLIGGWLLANALVDVSAFRVRHWIGTHDRAGSEHDGVSTPDPLSGPPVEQPIQPS